MAFNISKLFSLIQYFCAISAIILYRRYANTKIKLFFKSVKKKNPNFVSQNFTYNLSLYIQVYFIIYYLLKMLSLVIENKLYCSYMEMLYNIFKEVGKYLTFAITINLYFLFNKYIKEEEYIDESDTHFNNIDKRISSISSSYYD